MIQKILITTPIFPPESRGPAIYTAELARQLGRKRIGSTIITFTKDPIEIKGIKIISIPTGGGIIGRQTKLIQKIWEIGKDSDIIYAQGADVVGFVSVIAGKLLHKPVVIKFVGDLSVEMERDFHKKIVYLFFITKITLNLADKIVFPAKHLQETICAKYKINKDKTVVIYNAVN